MSSINNATVQPLSVGFLINGEFHGQRYEVARPDQNSFVKIVNNVEFRNINLDGIVILDINGNDITPISDNDKCRYLANIVSKLPSGVDGKGDAVNFTASRAFAIDMSLQPADYDMTVQFPTASERPAYFYICPEEEGDIIVELQHSEEQFTITAVQTYAYLGRPMPLRVKKVIKVGTTAKFNVML